MSSTLDKEKHVLLGKGYKTVELGEVCHLEKHQTNHTGLPYVGLEDIEAHTSRFLGRIEPTIVKSKTFSFSPRHLLYGRLRPYLNKIIAPNFAGHCSTEIFPIVPSELVERKFLLYWFRQDSIVRKINKTCTGARMPRANMKQVLGFRFLLAPLPEQKRIVAILDEAFADIAKAKANAEKNLVNAREVFQGYLDRICSANNDKWQRSELAEYVKFIDYRGKTPKKTATGLKLITAKNVKMGFLRKEPFEFIDPQNYESWMTRGIPQYGDVLFTTEAPLGNVAQLDITERVAFAQRVIIMQPNTSHLKSSFLKFLLLSPTMQRRIRAKGTGATATGIKASLLKKIEIAFPPSLDEQECLVKLLDDMVAYRSTLQSIYQQKVTALEELKQSLLHQAFTGQL